MKLQDFWTHVTPAPADMCWEWGRSIGGPGYGVCWIDGKCHNAHRVAYTLSYGLPMKGLDVRHLCHNRRCCNPAHLASGTRKQNMEDSVRDDRTARGEKAGPGKLSSDEVAQIRKMASYRTQQAIADHFGVNQCQISRVLRGKRRLYD